MAGHIGSLGVARQRQPVLAGDSGRPVQRAHEVLRLKGLVVHGERERMDGQIARADGVRDLLAPVGRLLRPEDLTQRITRQRPNKLLLLGLIGIALDGLQDFVGHLRAVLVANVTGQLCVSDVEMRFIDDYNFLQRRPRRGRRTGHGTDQRIRTSHRRAFYSGRCFERDGIVKQPTPGCARKLDAVVARFEQRGGKLHDRPVRPAVGDGAVNRIIASCCGQALLEGPAIHVNSQRGRKKRLHGEQIEQQPAGAFRCRRFHSEHHREGVGATASPDVLRARLNVGPVVLRAGPAHDEEPVRSE